MRASELKNLSQYRFTWYILIHITLIRIHLAENGHPLVGERVYIRDFVGAGNEPLPSPRLLLHAATLAVAHPVTGAPRGAQASILRGLVAGR